MGLRSIQWLCFIGLGSAFPLSTRQTTTSNSHSAKIIAPVVIVAVVCAMLVGFGWWKRRKRTRELIEQLQTPATNNNNSTNNATTQTTPTTGADAPARPPRRRRRRRPSQISTKSLPAYNEQAGDEEIVLVRPAQRNSESDDDSNEHDNPRPQASSSQAPDSRPLLDDDSSPDMPRVSLASSSRGRSLSDHPDPPTEPPSQLGHESIANATTIASSIAETELEPEPHPHGQAPSYAEAMSTSHVNLPSMSETEHTAQPSSSTATDDGPAVPADADATVRPKRKSVFRHLGRFNITKPSGSSAPAPEPTESVEMTSPRPSTSTHRPSGSLSTHRPSTSLSTNQHKPSPSLSSLSLILTRSQSPTMSRTSLNISAPISTTLVRTELNYPRAGPTPEQIRFLSSRESLGRFGMPYGEQAIAAAKSREYLPPVYKPRPDAGSGEGEAGTSTVPEDEPTTTTIRRGPILLTPGELAQRQGPETSASGPTDTTHDRTDPDPVLDPATTNPADDESKSEPEPIQPRPREAEARTDSPEPLGEIQVEPRARVLRGSPSLDPGDLLKDGRRESVMTTHSFVTATEGSAEDSSPPTPTAETYQTPALARDQTASLPLASRSESRQQTVLIPESRDALHPELTLVPATPIG